MKRRLFACVALFICIVAHAGADTVTNSAPVAKSCQIRNVKFGDLLRPRDASSANGTPLVLYPAQPWKCMTWKLLPAGDSVFQLRNHFTSKTFAAGATNQVSSPVVQVPFARDATARPAWQFVKLSDGTCEIVDVKSGQALTAVKSDDAPKIVLEPWSGQPEQKWELIEIDPARLTM